MNHLVMCRHGLWVKHKAECYWCMRKRRPACEVREDDADA